MTIRSLFDPSKDIYRTIEKVITYGASQEGRLKAEISEYVVTESIEEQFRKLLDRMQLAMESGGENEVGVWVSGFYGSGKSSFTKYLGLAFDDQRTIDGTPFINYLQDRLHKPQTKALLSTVAKRFPAAVVMLDLASEMLAGATMEDVSTVLYFKVLQWAGYSRNLKVAAFERMVEKDGRTPELHDRIAQALPGATWARVQNNPLAIDGLIPKIAHEMYPALFPEAKSFSSSTEGFFQFEDQRVQEMIDIVREKSGKQNIIFIVDEVGQYVASRDNLILNLDGLAKNLKRLGDGKAWIISTAQQTLTEDDPRAALNSDKLYKLKDRFPIQIDLESSDIKEICYRRLLGKSPTGETELGKLFDAHGQALRHNTKLQDAKYYDADFSKESFTNLYPFLPAHFDILLHLLGALAKSTGGIGLRSAIKVIQDVLKGEGGSKAMADQPVGWLATTVTLYDELEKDIRRAFTSIHQAVGKVQIRFPDSQLHQDIAKSVAVLQILGNLPVSVQNVASLMHPSITATSQLDTVRKAVEEMLGDVHVPLGEKDGNLVFLSEKLRDIEQERGAIALRTVDVKRIFNDALRDAELFEKTLQLLKGLPELGVLLQVERELPHLIRQVYVGKGTGLFAQQEQESWQQAEERLRSALTEFAQAAKSTYQGRLFAQDALQGLRLIDLCREVFDVVVMNPPFGALAANTKNQLAKAYPRSKNDLLAIMVERGLELLRAGGRIGAITSRACFYLSDYRKWREEIVLGLSKPEAVADLGLGVMDDAMVEAAAYVLEKHA